MSPSTPLPEADKQETSRETTPSLETEKYQLNFAANEQSTRTSSTVGTETEKKEFSTENGEITADEEAANAASASQDTGDYPSGVKLAFIVVALVLSVFLFSLDQVNLPLRVFNGDILILGSDHHCNRHSKDHRRIQEHQ
jgi:hypothetical protein